MTVYFSGVAGGYRVGHPKTSDQVTAQFRKLDGEVPWWSATPNEDGGGARAGKSSSGARIAPLQFQTPSARRSSEIDGSSRST